MFSKLKNHAFSAGFHSGTSNSGSSGSNPGSLHNLPGATSAVAANTNVPIAASNLSNVAALQQQPQQQQQTQSQPLAMQPASVMSNLSASLGPNVHLPQYLSTSSGQMSYPPLIQPASGISLNVGPTMMSSTMQNQPRNSSPAPSHAIANQSYQNVGPMMPMPPPAQLTQPQPMANSSSLPNAITQHFEIGSLIGSAGPELAWRIYSAIRKCDRMPASVFYFEKKWAERIHKPRRKETIVECLRKEPRALDIYRHPRILSLIHPLEENQDSMAYATEPVLGSLANAIGYLEERLQQNIRSPVRHYSFLEFEVKYGLLQIIEALMYLHTNPKTIHNNVCPQSILINTRGTWKLSGFEFIEKCSNSDPMNPITTQAFTSKLPKMAQPDLDYMAPEVQGHSFCNPNSDVFAFALLICSLYNNGRSPLESNLSTNQYLRQLEMLHRTVVPILDRVQEDLRHSVQSILEIDHRKRLNSQAFSTVKYFMDPAVRTLQCLDVLQMKDSAYKTKFYHRLSESLPDIPKKLWWQHILPSLEPDLNSSELPSAALQPLLRMTGESNAEQVQRHLLPTLRNVLSNCALRSVQAYVTVLDSLQLLSAKLTTAQNQQLVWPMLFNALDSSSPQVQCSALNAIVTVLDQLDSETVRRTVIPKSKAMFENNCPVMVQSNALLCIEKVIDTLEKSEILDDVLPMLLNAKLSEPIILMPVIRIYKQMMGDKRYGLTVNLLATKVLPSLTPVVVSPNLKLDEFSILVELLQNMMEHVSRNQRNKLKLEELAIPPTDRSQLHRTCDQPIGYPHRAPALRLDCRRTSISVDDVNRRPSINSFQFALGNGSNNNSGCNSPDSNLLQVTQQLLIPGRRHSDNTIQPPRILLQDMFADNFGNANGSHSGSAVNLNILRRHSAAAGVTQNNSIYSTAFNPNAGVDFLIPPLNPRSGGGNRRYSTAVVNYGASYQSNQSNTLNPSAGVGQPSYNNIFQTLGSGMQQLFNK